MGPLLPIIGLPTWGWLTCFFVESFSIQQDQEAYDNSEIILEPKFRMDSSNLNLKFNRY